MIAKVTPKTQKITKRAFRTVSLSYEDLINHLVINADTLWFTYFSDK